MKSIYLLGLCCLFGNAHAGLNVIADLGGNLPHLILTALIISPMNLNHQTRRRRLYCPLHPRHWHRYCQYPRLN